MNEELFAALRAANEELLTSDDKDHNTSGRLFATGAHEKVITWLKEEIDRGTDVKSVLFASLLFSAFVVSSTMLRTNAVVNSLLPEFLSEEQLGVGVDSVFDVLKEMVCKALRETSKKSFERMIEDAPKEVRAALIAKTKANSQFGYLAK